MGSLRQVLRSHCGDAWAAQLLSQLRKERREAAVDGNALQSALRCGWVGKCWENGWRSLEKMEDEDNSKNLEDVEVLF